MSLTTRCPACATLFRVVPDQLKVSGGWVRCGRCSEVFDARLTLSPALPVVTEVVEPPDQVPVEVSQVVPQVVLAAEAPATGALAMAVAEPVAVDSADEAPAAADPQRQDTSEAEAVPTTAEPAVDPSPNAPLDVPSDAPSDSSSGAPDTPAAPAPIADAPVLDDVSFVRDARRRAFWRRPGVRWSLAVASVLLLLGLALQVALHWRNQLALAAPGLQPALKALCIPFKCRVGAPRMIESVTFDGSSFTRLQPDVYRLNVTLANSATVPVAMPSLELTLTDAQDQPVLRRVLLPGDFGSDVPPSLPPGGEWSTTLTLSVTPGSTSGNVVGYRLLAFYP